MKSLKHKYPQTPTPIEARDIYFDDLYGNDFDYDDSYYPFDYEDYYDNQTTFFYAYIPSLDKFITNSEKIKNLGEYDTSGYDVYEDFEGIIHTPVYSFYGVTKTEALLGCLMIIINEENKPISAKVKKLYGKLSNKYPEVVFKLLNVLE